MGTFLLWVIVTVLVGLLLVKFMFLDPAKKGQAERMLVSFYNCSLTEVAESCKAAGIGFGNSQKFRHLLNLKPSLVGNAYGALLKAEGVVVKPRLQGEPPEHDYRIILLAEELANVRRYSFTDKFLNGMSSRYPEYALELQDALITANENLGGKRSQTEREKTLQAGIKALGGNVKKKKKKKANTFDCE